jgi:hypothetical protein
VFVTVTKSRSSGFGGERFGYIEATDDRPETPPKRFGWVVVV